MGFEPMFGRGASRAKVICDACGRADVFPADYETKRTSRDKQTLIIVGPLVQKAQSQGWSHIKGKMHCPTCEAKRKALSTQKKQDAAMVTLMTPARKMTPEMELDIMEALFASYDRKAKRYTKGDTDRTVADAVGGGCMPGWVANIRAEKFGPAGNEDAEKLRGDLDNVKSALSLALTAAANDFQQQINKFVADYAAEHKRVIGEMQARLNALYKAEDKRVK